jgi:hypothetical protein
MATQPQVTAGPRLLVAVLAGLLLLLVGLLVVRPLLGGNQEEAAAPPATAGAASSTTPPSLIGPSTSVTPSAEASGSVKDPFQPATGTGTAAAASGAVAPVTPTTVAATGSTVAGAGAGTATTPAGGSSAEHQVALVSISGNTARVTVDGADYTVGEGESFADGYRAVDIGNECATFESGTTSFTLCEGEAVLK